MTALVLDTGALIAVERGDARTHEAIASAQRYGIEIRTSAVVVAEVWRDPRGRQAQLAKLLRSIVVVPVDEPQGRAAGALLGRSGTANAIDALVVLTAADGDAILTSDPGDITHLVAASGRRRVRVVPV